MAPVESLTRRSASRYTSAAECPSDPLRAERLLALSVIGQAVRDRDRDFFMSPDFAFWLSFLPPVSLVTARERLSRMMGRGGYRSRSPEALRVRDERILELLRADPRATTRDVARRAGCHPSFVRRARLGTR